MGRNRETTSTTAAVLFVVCATVLTLTCVGSCVNNATASGAGPDTIVVRKTIDVHAEGERIYYDGENEVHFCKVDILRDAKDGYLTFQVYADSTNAEKDNFGTARGDKLLKPVEASSYVPSYDGGEIPLMFVDKEGLWVAYKNTPGSRILMLTGEDLYIIMSR